MPIVGKLPQIVDFNFRQPRFLSPAGDAVIQRPAKEVRKNRDNVGLHCGSKTFTLEDTETSSFGVISVSFVVNAFFSLPALAPASPLP